MGTVQSKFKSAGKRSTIRKPRMYKGCEIRGTGVGYHHLYFNGQCIKAGLPNLHACRQYIDNEVSPNLTAMGL